MATRFYLPTAGPVDLFPAVGSGWNTASLVPCYPTRTSKLTTPQQTGVARAKVSQAGAQNVLDRQFISAPLSAQTISGTHSAVFYGLQSATTADAWLQIIIRVVSGDGLTVRGTLYAGSTASATSAVGGNEAQEWGTTGATRIKSAIAVSSVTAQAGDRLLIEIGFRAITANTSTVTLNYGDTSADQTLAAGNVTNTAPWVELSATITFATPSVPTGTAVSLLGGSNSDATWASTAGATGQLVNPTAIGVGVWLGFGAVAGAVITSISGGNCTWIRVYGPITDATSGYSMEGWFGVATATGSAALTITWSTTPSSGLLTQRHFSAGAGTVVWSLDGIGGVKTIASGNPVSWTTLTPSANNRLYIGSSMTSNSPASPAGTTSGFTFEADAYTDPMCYNGALSAAGSPVTTGSASPSASTVTGAALLVANVTAAAGPPPGQFFPFLAHHEPESPGELWVPRRGLHLPGRRFFDLAA